MPYMHQCGSPQLYIIIYYRMPSFCRLSFSCHPLRLPLLISCSPKLNYLACKVSPTLGDCTHDQTQLNLNVFEWPIRETRCSTRDGGNWIYKIYFIMTTNMESQCYAPAQRCICGHSFDTPGAFTRDRKSCQKCKRQLGNVRLRAKEAYVLKKQHLSETNPSQESHEG